MIIRSINALVGEKTDKKHMLFLLFFFFSSLHSSVGGETDHKQNNIFYCCVTNYITFSDLKQHTLIMSISVVRSLSMA